MKVSEHYTHFNKFLFRTPLLPIEYNDDHFIDSALFKESIFIASRDLYDTLNKSKVNKDDSKRSHSIFKYMNRMKFRCIPFGLFAGVGVGQVGVESKILLKEPLTNSTRTRLDMDLICSLTQHISSHADFNIFLKYLPNSSIYRMHNSFRYVDYKYVGSKRKHYLSEIESSSELEGLLLLCKEGVLRKDLVDFLLKADVEQEDAITFVAELIDSQFFVSELEPHITGDDVLDVLIAKLVEINPSHDITTSLRKINKILNQIDSIEIGRSIDQYERVEAEVQKIGIAYERKNLFQTDMIFHPNQAFLGNDIIEQALKGFSLLSRFTSYKENSRITRFKEEFYNRYEEEEIPLAEALDSDLGIGFANSVPENTDINELLIGLPNFNSITSQQLSEMKETDVFLIEKYISCNAIGSRELIITDEEVERFTDDSSNFPSVMSSMIEVVNLRDEKIQCLVMSSVFSNGANLMSRFSHLNKSIYDVCKEIVKKEEESVEDDKIMAEVVHLPESRMGNILCRVPFRKYEIPYLAKSSVELNDQISIDDLLVSVRGGQEIILRSKKHNKRIIPRLTSAHNYNFESLPIYQFLCGLQNPGVMGGISFSWPSVIRSKKYFPRVRYKNTILAPERWVIGREELTAIPKITDAKFAESFEDFKQKRKLTQKVYVVEGDNKLLIDFSNTTSVHFFYSEYRGKEIVIEEVLFDAENAFVRAESGEGYNSQLLISFFKK